MKILFAIIALILMNNIFANTTIQVVGRIEVDKNTIRLIRSVEGDSIPSMLHKKDLAAEISKLNPGDEAIVTGHITYLPTMTEAKTDLQPVFIIESIKPISLKLLGQTDMKIDDLRLTKIDSKSAYSPITIPVTTEVASAIILTTSLMLMQSLTASPDAINTNQQLNSGLILFSGVLATGVFIYDQLTGTKK